MSDRDTLIELLREIADGRCAPDDAADRLQPTVELDYATVDLDRERRTGLPEVIFGQGKSAEQIAGVARVLYERGQRVLATRVDAAAALEILPRIADLPARYESDARCLCIEDSPAPDRGRGLILVISAGTSDSAVAAEAAVTARMFGNRVQPIRDVGVAGIHRLLRKMDLLREASVLIVVAGMEGALPSVVGGLVARPVIAVPTSVGYGASFGGLAALLGMLNACASGITVVNIDNGFGAAYAATLMNRRDD